jgi:hypothetical protein
LVGESLLCFSDKTPYTECSVPGLSRRDAHSASTSLNPLARRELYARRFEKKSENWKTTRQWMRSRCLLKNPADYRMLVPVSAQPSFGKKLKAE